MNVGTLRLDKWLWYARFLRSRSLAAKLCHSGKIRVNGDPIKKAHQSVRPGDILTFPLESHIRVIKILELTTRRGPAKEAQGLYEDLEPPYNRLKKEDPSLSSLPAQRDPGAGRPTKFQRRAIERLMGWLIKH